jgi:glycosyltransferase involved in cell wall biosynthesis
MLPTLFASAKIRQKTFYRPLGVELPDRWQRHEDHADDKPIQLLFINSWHQMASNFFLRGGLDILEAFSVLHTRYPRLHLTIRSNLPELDDHYHRIIEHGWVRLIRRFMPHEEMAALFGESHIFLLPAARIHIVSLLQAMSYGLAVVASDGWGIEEYITHEHNGLIVRGRYGRASWADNASGMLRENYHVMHSPEPTVVGGLVAAISRLVEDRELCVRLGTQARADVRDKYNIHQWNEGLRSVFDHAIGGARPPDRATHVAA